MEDRGWGTEVEGAVEGRRKEDGDGGWRMGDGERRKEDGDAGRGLGDRGKRTEDGRWRAEDGG